MRREDEASPGRTQQNGPLPMREEAVTSQARRSRLAGLEKMDALRLVHLGIPDEDFLALTEQLVNELIKGDSTIGQISF
jgi:hypothetical protein